MNSQIKPRIYIFLFFMNNGTVERMWKCTNYQNVAFGKTPKEAYSNWWMLDAQARFNSEKMRIETDFYRMHGMIL